LNRMQQAKFSTNVRLTALEIDAIGLRPHWSPELRYFVLILACFYSIRW
jgi:hypothetical protein